MEKSADKEGSTAAIKPTYPEPTIAMRMFSPKIGNATKVMCVPMRTRVRCAAFPLWRLLTLSKYCTVGATIPLGYQSKYLGEQTTEPGGIPTLIISEFRK